MRSSLYSFVAATAFLSSLFAGGSPRAEASVVGVRDAGHSALAVQPDLNGHPAVRGVLLARHLTRGQVRARHTLRRTQAVRTTQRTGRRSQVEGARSSHGAGVSAGQRVSGQSLVRRAPALVPVTAQMTQMLALINAERAQAGVGALVLDPVLDAVAQGRSQDMIDRNYFSHQIPGVGWVYTILDQQNVQYQMVGENIALNNYINFYPLEKTISQTNTDLMNSPEHRVNILEPTFSRVGLGFAFEQGTGKLIATEVFTQP